VVRRFATDCASNMAGIPTCFFGRSLSKLGWAPPPLATGEALARRFAEDSYARRWRARQVAVLQAHPTISQQDYTLYNLIVLREELTVPFWIASLSNQPPVIPLPSKLNCNPFFRAKSSVSTSLFRQLLRFLCGAEDFARVNAHYKRREAHPILTREDCKRACLSCLVRRNHIILDSEWHALFDCPLTHAPRSLFIHAVPTHTITHIIGDSFRILIELVLAASNNSELVDELARLVGGVLMCRRREFRALAPR
jgi:hypothetical protein